MRTPIDQDTRNGRNLVPELRFALARLALVAGVVAMAVGCSSDESPDRSRRSSTIPEPRSLLLVTIDTIRPDRLEPYGATDVATPTLGHLANRGVVFERAYSVAPITLVAHTTILSGLYPPQHGVRNNGMHYVPPEIETLAEMFTAKGHRTSAFVSAAVLERTYGLDQGFEHYDDDLSTGRERHPRLVPDRPAEATVASATSWLNSLDEDEPFFSWVHFYDPHAAYSPPPPFRDDYRDRLYDGEVAYLDAQLEDLFAHPRVASGETAIVVVGDHGESLGEHGEQTHAILAYDSTLHVPLIVRIPGVEAGRRVQSQVDQADLVPTLIELFRLNSSMTNDEFPGRSLLPLLVGEAPLPPRLLYAETYLPYYTYGWAKLRVARRGQWKLIDAPERELYELVRDPRELSDVAEQQPAVTHDLGRDLDEWLEQAAGDDDLEATLQLDSDAADKLRSLGYLAAGSGSAIPAGEDRPNPRDLIGLHVNLERARSVSRLGLFEQATRLVREVLEQDPNNLAALIDLASYLEQDGEVETALRALEQALSLDPGYARLHLQLSGLEARRGRHDQALALIDQALELDPNSIQAKLQRVFRLIPVGRGEEAAADLARLVTEHPERPEVLLAHAQLVDAPSGNLQEAERRIRGALDRDPFLVGAWAALGQLLEGQRRDAEATEAYREALKRQPDHADLHARLGLLLARQQAGAEAESQLREAIRLSDDLRPDLHLALGSWLAERGRMDEAQRQYQVVLDEEPGHPMARNNRAIANYRTGQLAQARAELEELVSEHPDYADAHNNLAAVLVDRSEWSAAERHARRALELGVEAPAVLNNLGLALENTGRPDEARVRYERALELEDGYWPARYNLGVVLARLGSAREAVAELERVVSQVPDYPEVYLELGRLFADELGEQEKARTHYNAFLKLAPRDPRSAEVRQLVSELVGAR